MSTTELPPNASWSASIGIVLLGLLVAVPALRLSAYLGDAFWVGPEQQQPELWVLSLLGAFSIVTAVVGAAVLVFRLRVRVFLSVAVVVGSLVLPTASTFVLMAIRWEDAGIEVPIAANTALLIGVTLGALLVRNAPFVGERRRFLAWLVPIATLAAIAVLTPWAGVARALMPVSERHSLAAARFGPSYVGAFRTVQSCNGVFATAPNQRIAVSPFKGRAYKRRDGQGGAYHFLLSGGPLRTATVAIVAQEIESGYRFVNRNSGSRVAVDVREWPWSSPTRVPCPMTEPLLDIDEG